MKKPISIFFVLFASCLLFAGFFKRNELDEYKRNNPTDRKAGDYQGYVSGDGDGDGEADFTFLINNDAAATDSPNIQLNITGPYITKIYISRLSSMQGAEQLNFSEAIKTASGYNFGYTLLGGEEDTFVTLYAQFQFINGDTATKIYQDGIYYGSIEVTNWLAHPSAIVIDNSNGYTTNTSISVVIHAPTNTEFFKSNFYSNFTGTDHFFQSNLQMEFPAYDFVTNIDLFVEISYDGAPKLLTNSITYVPWRDFSFTINSNDLYTTSSNVVLTFSNIYDSVSQIRIANSSDFSDASPWFSPVASTNWILSPGVEEKTFYLELTNQDYGLSYKGIYGTMAYDDINFDNEPPIISISAGPTNDITTNFSFFIKLNVFDYNTRTGYWQTNSGGWHTFSVGSGNITINETTTLQYYAQDVFGNNSGTNTVVYTISN